MAAESSKNIDRYIMQALLSQVKRVFGVEPYFSLRSDYSDAQKKIDNNKSQRASERCFIRPASYAILREGYRAAALAGRGHRAAARDPDDDQLPRKFDVLHPVPIQTDYNIAFELSTYDKILDLFSIWANAVLTASLDFKIEYDMAYYTCHVIVGEELQVPDFGQSGGNERTDVTRLEGTIAVQGYTMSVIDPHQVPIIRYPHVANQFSLPD